MRPTIVVVGDILPQNGAEVPLVDNDHVIQTLSAKRAYYPFGDGVRLRGSDRGEFGFDAQPSCPWIEAPTIAAVAIPYGELRLLAPRCGLNQPFARLSGRCRWHHAPRRSQPTHYAVSTNQDDAIAILVTYEWEDRGRAAHLSRAGAGEHD